MSDRKEVIEKFAKKANEPKRSAGEYLGIFLQVIQLVLARKGQVKIPGFGTFNAKTVPERKGVNPRTGKKITFAPGVRLSFKPGKPLKEAVMNGSFATKAKKPRSGKKPKRKK